MKHANFLCLTLTACVIAVGGCARGMVELPPSPELMAYDQPAGPRSPASITVIRTDQGVTLTGSLATEQEKLAFTERAGELFVEQLDAAGLQVDSRTRPSNWIDQVLVIMQNMAILSEFSIDINGDNLTLTATAGSQEEADGYVRDAYSIIAGKLAIKSDFAIRSSDESQLANLASPSSTDIEPAVMEFQAAAKPVVDANLLDTETPGFDEVPLASFEHGNTDEPLQVISREVIATSASDEPSIGAAMAAVDDEPRPQLNGYLKNVRFYGGSDKLTQRARVSLDTLADALRERPDARLAVMSYTSNAGKPWELKDKARMRAKSVVTYLARQGVALDRLQGYALGHVNGSGDQIVIQEIQ